MFTFTFYLLQLANVITHAQQASGQTVDAPAYAAVSGSQTSWHP